MGVGSKLDLTSVCESLQIFEENVLLQQSAVFMSEEMKVRGQEQVWPQVEHSRGCEFAIRNIFNICPNIEYFEQAQFWR